MKKLKVGNEIISKFSRNKYIICEIRKTQYGSLVILARTKEKLHKHLTYEFNITEIEFL